MPVFDLVDYHCGVKLPTRGSREAAGLDLYSCKHVTIPAGKIASVSTGLRCRFNPRWVALLWDRSGLGSLGLHLFAGVIDSDYRGVWSVIIYNSTDEDIVVNEGDKIAQVLFQRVWTRWPRWGYVKNDTERGCCGFGSTGK